MSAKFQLPSKQYLFRSATGTTVSAANASLSTALIVMDRNSGNLGFNTEDPISKFHFVGNMTVSGNLTVNGQQTVQQVLTNQTEELRILNSGAGTLSTAMLVQTNNRSYPLAVFQVLSAAGVQPERIAVIQNGTLSVAKAHIGNDLTIGNDIVFNGNIYQGGRRFYGAQDAPEIRSSVNSFTMKPSSLSWVTENINPDFVEFLRMHRSILFRTNLIPSQGFEPVFRRRITIIDPDIVGSEFVVSNAETQFLAPPGKCIIQVTYILDQNFQRVSFQIDDTVLEEDIDLFSPIGSGVTRQVVTYTYDFEVGQHEFIIKGLCNQLNIGIVDKNLGSTGYGFGIGDITIISLGLIGNVVKLTNAEADNLIVNSSITVRQGISNATSVPGRIHLYDLSGNTYLEIAGGGYAVGDTAIIQALDSSGNNNVNLSIQPNANVGFGTRDPEYRFDMRGNVPGDFIARVLNSNPKGHGILFEAQPVGFEGFGSEQNLEILNVGTFISQISNVTSSATTMTYFTVEPHGYEIGDYVTVTDLSGDASGLSIEDPVEILNVSAGSFDVDISTLSGTYVPGSGGIATVVRKATINNIKVNLNPEETSFAAGQLVRFRNPILLNEFMDGTILSFESSVDPVSLIKTSEISVEFYAVGEESTISAEYERWDILLIDARNSYENIISNTIHVIEDDTIKTFLVNKHPSDTAIAVGRLIRMYYSRDKSFFMEGTVTEYIHVGGENRLIMNVSSIGGSGEFSSWILVLTDPTELDTTVYPLVIRNSLSSHVYNSGLIHMSVTADGNVGFGTMNPEAKVHFDYTDSIILPKGTTLERPLAPVTGMIRYNTTKEAFEWYNPSSSSITDKWDILRETPPVTWANVMSGIAYTGGFAGLGTLSPLYKLDINLNGSTPSDPYGTAIRVFNSFENAVAVGVDFQFIEIADINLETNGDVTFLCSINHGFSSGAVVSIVDAIPFDFNMKNVVVTSGTLNTFTVTPPIPIPSGTTYISGGKVALRERNIPFIGTPNGGDRFSIRTGNIDRITVDTNGNVAIGTTSASQRMVINGNALILGSLSVSNLSVANNIVTNSLSVQTAYITNPVFTSNLTVSSLSVVSNLTVNGMISVTNLSVSSNIRSSNLTVENLIRTVDQTVTSSLSASNLIVEGSSRLYNLSVSGISRFFNPLMITSSLSVGGYTHLSNDVILNGNLSIGSSLDVNGDITSSGNIITNYLSVGNIRVQNQLSVNQIVTQSITASNIQVSNLDVTANATFSGLLTIDRLSVISNVEIGKNLSVSNLFSTTISASSLIVTSLITSQNILTSEISIGNANIQERLNVSDTVRIRIPSIETYTEPIAVGGNIAAIDTTLIGMNGVGLRLGNATKNDLYILGDSEGFEFRENDTTALRLHAPSGNLYVGSESGITDTGYKLFVNGDINLEGNLYQNGVLYAPSFEPPVIDRYPWIAADPDVSVDLIPTGSYFMYSWSNPSLPTDYRKCNGDYLDRQDFSELFSIIGTSYGYLTPSDFALPTISNHIIKCRSSEINKGIIPIGSILRRNTDTLATPNNYLVCDGSALNRILYADLFAVIGTIYGDGDTLTTFNLPNLANMIIKFRSPETFETLPLGVMIYYSDAIPTIPKTFLRTNGGYVPRGRYPELYETITTLYGSGDGISTFGIPNVSDTIIRVLRSADIALVDDTNKVGIGLSNPSFKLDVMGGINFTEGIYQNGVPFRADSDHPVSQYFEEAEPASSEETVPIGSIVGFTWSATSLPTRYLQCDGSAVSRNLYTELFAVIGTTYGMGDGVSTFNLPNMTDMIIKHSEGDLQFRVIGTIYGFSWEVNAPDGFLRCDGRAINRVTYAALFTVIGTNYGPGDGINTFNLPNFFGKIISYKNDPLGIPTGVYFQFGNANTIPNNYLYCDGSAISRVEYQQLYEAIRNTYGAGNGFTTFNLPILYNTVIRSRTSMDIYYKDGNIAIGKDKADYTLDVKGDIHFTGNIYKNGIPFREDSSFGINEKWHAASNDFFTETLFVGTILNFSWDAATPTDYLKCDGAEISRSVYSDLFSVIGTAYGEGNGITTFQLPHFYGMIIKSTHASGIDLKRVFVGSILNFSWDAATPTDYLKCDGTEISRSVYSDLFSVIGTAYGEGDGITTFQLPHFYGMIIKVNYPVDNIDIIPNGVFLTYPWTATIPDHYLKCDGSELSRLEYSDLYEKIRNSYGAGNGFTTFNIPHFHNMITRYRLNSDIVYMQGNVAIGKPIAESALDVNGIVQSHNTPKCMLSMVLDYASNPGTFKYTFLKSFNIDSVNYTLSSGNVNVMTMHFTKPFENSSYIVQYTETPMYYNLGNVYTTTANYVSKLTLVNYTTTNVQFVLYGSSGQNLTPGRIDMVIYDPTTIHGPPIGSVS